MRASMGNSLLLNLVIVFSGIVILFFIGIISYSKAYRVKNRIIEVIEKYNGYTTSGATNARSDIENTLRQIGYSITSRDYCNSGKVQQHMDRLVGGRGSSYNQVNRVGAYASRQYNYCVFEVTGKSSSSGTGTNNSKYYVVVTFVHFDFPVIGDMINIPIYGETKILGRKYDY